MYRAETANHLQTVMKRDEGHPLLEMFDPERRWKVQRKPLMIRGKEAHDQLGLPLPIREPTPSVSPVPPWTDLSHNIHTEFCNVTNKAIQLPTIKSKFLELLNTTYLQHTHLYTDGSHDPGSSRTAASLYLERKKRVITWKLTDQTEIAVAEIFAIKKALQYILEKEVPKTVIFSDSKSALYMLKDRKPTSYNEIIYETQKVIMQIQGKGLTFDIQWIPSHCNIRGNEVADQAAKMGLQNLTSEMNPLPATTYNNLTKRATMRNWTSENKARISTNHLGTIRDDLRQHPWARSRRRRIDTALLRLRIGHCGFKAHLHRINLEESGDCEWCQQPDTINHFFFDCPRHFSARTDLKEKLRGKQVPFTLKNILGGGDFTPETNHFILNHVKVYLRKSGRLDQI